MRHRTHWNGIHNFMNWSLPIKFRGITKIGCGANILSSCSIFITYLGFFERFLPDLKTFLSFYWDLEQLQCVSECFEVILTHKLKENIIDFKSWEAYYNNPRVENYSIFQNISGFLFCMMPRKEDRRSLPDNTWDVIHLKIWANIGL